MRFGQAASDYTPVDAGGEVWIRTFKDPATQIRICPAERVNEKGVTVYGSNAWAMEREHYADGIGSFPCAERFGVDCVGCSDPNEDVSQKSRKYYFNAVDEKGQLRVYKIGVKLYKVFKAREQRALSVDPSNKQPLSDRDYIINRTGKGLATDYDPEPGDKYKVEWPENLHDIDQILTDRYAAAEEAYGVTSVPVEQPSSTPTAKKGNVSLDDIDAMPSTITDDEWKSWGDAPTEEQITSAETAVIKEWLDHQKVEYPARTPRARLIELAKKVSGEPPF